MKQLVKLSLVPLLAANLFASSFIFVEEGVSLPLADGSVVYSGTPVEVIGIEGDNVKVKVKGVVGDKEPSSVYATKNLVLILAKAKDAGMIKKSGDEATVELLVPAKNVTDSQDKAWDKSADRYYEKCTQCHAGKVIVEHTMLEWDALYGSMKEFANPSEEDTALVMRYLRAFAKDGILKE